MAICSAPTNCSIPADYIVYFDADPDIDGIGVIASFYIAAWLTLVLLTVTYFTSGPDEFDNFGFSKLDVYTVQKAQEICQKLYSRLFGRDIYARAGSKTIKALKNSILILSDQQLITGVSICVVGFGKICEITQYHFNTVINLALAASVAHSMTFSFVHQYIEQNWFFRTWRAVSMLILGALLLATWTVIGSNDWLLVYGLQAQCGFKNLGQSFGPPATTSLALLYWFLLRGYAYSLTILFPRFTKLKWFLLILSTTFWLAKLCDILQQICKKTASQVYHYDEVLQQIRRLPNVTFTLRTLSYLRTGVRRGTWSLACFASLVVFVVIYSASQVWASFLFILCWTAYTLVGSSQMIAAYRATALTNGMIGDENQWSFGQQLPLLMLILPAFAIAETFFEDISETNTISSRSSSKTGLQTLEPRTMSGTSSIDSGMDDQLQEEYVARGRMDTEQQLGMDISDAIIEPTILSHHISEGETVNELDPTNPSQRPKLSFISELISYAESDQLRENLWANGCFKLSVLIIFAYLSYIIVYYGI